MMYKYDLVRKGRLLNDLAEDAQHLLDELNKKPQNADSVQLAQGLLRLTLYCYREEVKDE